MAILTWVLITVTCLFLTWLYWADRAEAHGEPNWSADIFGDKDGTIELYRDNVNFHSILAEEISDYNAQRPTRFADEASFVQVTERARADVIIHSYVADKPGCWGYAYVWIGAPDEVGISTGCWESYRAGNKQPLRGAILHEIIGHLNGLHHHETCTPPPNQQTVMEIGLAGGNGCGISLTGLGPHDIATLREPG